MYWGWFVKYHSVCYDLYSNEPLHLWDLYTVTNLVAKGALDSPMGTQSAFGSFKTEHRGMKEVVKTAQQVAPSDVNILLTGESGTGKNLLSKSIHQASGRSSAPYVPVNCLAIPDTLIESELFGHEKGAFTDAHRLKLGSFETANGGTLYLDEIGDMTHSAQGKILLCVLLRAEDEVRSL